MSTRSDGALAENMAAQFLREKGFCVLSQNFCIAGGEIDLICKDGEAIVFVEVKMRRQGQFGSPEESLSQQKLGFLRRASYSYLQKQGLSPYDADIRMDLVAIEHSYGKDPEIRHYKNAFYFDDF